MTGSPLRDHVDEVLGRPDADVAFARRLHAMESDVEGAPAPEDVQHMTELARNYVYAVIGMIEKAAEEASRQGVRHISTGLLNVAREYFLADEDLIPDSEGLYGLIDDAYLAHRFVIRLSEAVEKEKGFPLLSELGESPLPIMRALIGEEIAIQLDRRLEESLRLVLTRFRIARLAALTGTLPGGGSDLWEKLERDRERLTWTPKG